MKITIATSFFPPWRGGVETYVYSLSKQLREHGHEITVICGNPPQEPGVEFVDGLRVERLGTCGRLYGTPIIPRLFQKLADTRADIIHANFPTPYVACIASTISRMRGVPAVLTWHNDLTPVTRMAGVLVAIHDQLVLPFYLPQFRFIVATSKVYAENSRILSAHKGRVVVIPNGVDTLRFNPDTPGDDVRARLGVGREKIVLFVGALTQWHRYKGLDVLIQAMALVTRQVPEARLLIVGAGRLETEYRQMVNQLGLTDSAIFAGNVTDDELPEYYASSDILVLPSKDESEGFGLVILEANATGKPAIGTAVGGIPSVIRDGYNGLLVPPNNPEVLASVIKRALTDADLLEQMGNNARRLAERHDWSIVARQTEILYRRAIAQH